MTDIHRKVSKNETLKIHPCPYCEGDVKVRECGYTTFNPGYASCSTCKKEWSLGYVDDQWGAGEVWNEKAAKMAGRIGQLRFIKMRFEAGRMLSPSRDCQNEAMEEGCLKLLDDLIKGAR